MKILSIITNIYFTNLSGLFFCQAHTTWHRGIFMQLDDALNIISELYFLFLDSFCFIWRGNIPSWYCVCMEAVLIIQIACLTAFNRHGKMFSMVQPTTRN